LLGQQRYDDAARQAQAILARFPDNVSALACHAMAQWKNGAPIEDSIAQMQRAVALAPLVASLRHNLATLLASRGDFEFAAEQFRDALRIKPDDTMAFYGLTQNFRFNQSEPLIDDMIALHRRPDLPDRASEFLAFGLAKVFDDLGVPERAMAYALEANRLGARPWDIAGEAAQFEQLEELARLDAFRRARPSGHPSRAPLFIVGMPRSGTTLVEAILSRHPEVLTHGEASGLPVVEERALRRLTPSHRRIGRHELILGLDRDWLTARAEEVLQRAMAGATPKPSIVTDKLPENAVRLGLVARLFPNARVVHVRRHPLDVGVSNFFQRFSHGQGYSTRLEWTGIRTRQIAESMAIWKRAVDLPILDLSYERLVEDPEGQVRRLLDFAGLEWTPDVLEPRRTARAVLTASQWQVRQPIYRGSVARWKRYERWLGPMLEAMGGFAWIDREVAASSG
jgi:tetratricopeptide (TPR) repeat protein